MKDDRDYRKVLGDNLIRIWRIEDCPKQIWQERVIQQDNHSIRY